MSKSDNRAVPSSGVEKRGGYSGGTPASSVKPPVKLASGAIKSSNASAKSELLAEGAVLWGTRLR